MGLRAGGTTTSTRVTTARTRLRTSLTGGRVSVAVSGVSAGGRVRLSKLRRHTHLRNLSTIRVTSRGFGVRVRTTGGLDRRGGQSLRISVGTLRNDLTNRRGLLNTAGGLGSAPKVLTAVGRLRTSVADGHTSRTAVNTRLIGRDTLLGTSETTRVNRVGRRLTRVGTSTRVRLLTVNNSRFDTSVRGVRTSFGSDVGGVRDLKSSSATVRGLVGTGGTRTRVRRVRHRCRSLGSGLRGRRVSPLSCLSRTGGLRRHNAGTTRIANGPTSLSGIGGSTRSTETRIFSLRALASGISDDLRNNLRNLFASFVSNAGSTGRTFTSFTRNILDRITGVVTGLLVRLTVRSVLSTCANKTDSNTKDLVDVINTKIGRNNNKVNSINHSEGIP